MLHRGQGRESGLQLEGEFLRIGRDENWIRGHLQIAWRQWMEQMDRGLAIVTLRTSRKSECRDKTRKRSRYKLL